MVRLYYRSSDQSEDWIAVEMTERYGRRIPSRDSRRILVPGWDLMYAIEAVDAAGSGSFYPDLEVR